MNCVIMRLMFTAKQTMQSEMRTVCLFDIINEKFILNFKVCLFMSKSHNS